MKEIRDRFSGHSKVYKKYRPKYPESLYAELLKHTPGRENCWDCGTGNGQVARVLAGHFKQVYATDISKNQLAQAPDLPNIRYNIQRAERTAFPDNTFDLITVAQAVHWFDLQEFYREATRVARPGAVLAVWGYGLLYFREPMDALISGFYREVVGPYWDGERRHIDSGYETIGFTLKKVGSLNGFRIEQPMDLETLQGYLTSWSSVQNYIRAKAENPVVPLIERLRKDWKEGKQKTAQFPIFGKIGRIEK